MMIMIKKTGRERGHQLVETGHCRQTKLRKVEKVFYQRVLLPPVHLKWDCRPLLPLLLPFTLLTVCQCVNLIIMVIFIMIIIMIIICQPHHGHFHQQNRWQ